MSAIKWQGMTMAYFFPYVKMNYLHWIDRFGKTGKPNIGN